MKHLKGFGQSVTYAAAALLLTLAAVVGSAATSWAEPPPLGKKKIVYPHDSSGTAQVMFQVASTMLRQVGYNVDEKTMSTGLIYQALATGAAEIYSSSFLPGQNAHINKYEGKLDILSTSYAPVPSGLMAPAYAPFNTIADLKKPEVQKMLKGKIISGESSWGVSIRGKATVKAYGLDFKVVNSSGAVMAAAFKKAFAKKEPIVITGWCPHYLCALYPTKFLTDTKDIWTYTQDFYVARLGFREDFPRATAVLSRVSLTTGMMSRMLVWMEQEKIDAAAAASRWIKQNPVLVWYWIGDMGANIEKPASLK